MADAIVGKWRSDGSKVTGYNEFREATGHADRWPAEPESVNLEISRAGDEWTVVIQHQDKPAQTNTYKEGVKKTIKIPDGTELEVVGRVEGNKWVMEVNARGNVIHSTVYVDGNELVQEQTLKGATLVTRHTRV